MEEVRLKLTLEDIRREILNYVFGWSEHNTTISSEVHSITAFP